MSFGMCRDRAFATVSVGRHSLPSVHAELSIRTRKAAHRTRAQNIGQVRRRLDTERHIWSDAGVGGGSRTLRWSNRSSPDSTCS
jgi:hypothetical protein